MIFEILTLPHTKPHRFIMPLESAECTLSDTLKDMKEKLLKKIKENLYHDDH